MIGGKSRLGIGLLDRTLIVRREGKKSENKKRRKREKYSCLLKAGSLEFVKETQLYEKG
jgi:hypothetical protein